MGERPDGVAWRSGCETHERAMAAAARWLRLGEPFAGGLVGTLRRGRKSDGVIAVFRAGAGPRLQKPAASSAFSSIGRLRDVAIDKKVIGHSGDVKRPLFAARGSVRGTRGAVPLFQKQPGDRGIGLIREPLVHEGRDFLAQIGGVGEARQFKALERSFRSRQQKIPRRLVQTAGHGDPRCWVTETSPVITVQ